MEDNTYIKGINAFAADRFPVDFLVYSSTFIEVDKSHKYLLGEKHG